MEGISHEACSLAGTMGLGKLIAFYDDNGISIDGEVEGWYTDNVPQRFESYSWHVIPNIDGHDADAVKQAIEDARRHSDKPTLICCKTLIGWGSPNKQGTESCHGAALGDDEVALVRETIGWTHPPFEVPEKIYQGWDAKEKGRVLENDWNNRFDEYTQLYPQLAEEFRRRQFGQLPKDWEKAATDFIHETDRKAENIASRKASQNSISAYAPLLPELIGGSADLAASNLTLWPQAEDVNKGGVSGNYVFYGAREFGMSAIMNGLSLYGGLIPFGATFLTFSDYSRNALRMAALMKTRAIHVFTHDSIGLGEDGPTHQPVEHLASLRLIPNMQVWRPCDAVESAVAWKVAIENREGPTCLIFSRQGLPHQSRSDQQLENIKRGGYTLLDCDGKPEVILIATGSEVSLATEAAGILSGQGKRIRVVSMPCTNTFAQQNDDYRESVLPSAVTSRVSVEAGSTDSWYKYIGLSGKAIGIDRFGESAPAGDLFREFNLTVDHVVEVVTQTL
jgi:transketolase